MGSPRLVKSYRAQRAPAFQNSTLQDEGAIAENHVVGATAGRREERLIPI
jgi:hypothetical protein